MVDCAIGLLGKCERFGENEEDTRKVAVQVQLDPLLELGTLLLLAGCSSADTSRLAGMGQLGGGKCVNAFSIDQLRSSMLVDTGVRGLSDAPCRPFQAELSGF